MTSSLPIIVQAALAASRAATQGHLAAAQLAGARGMVVEVLYRE